MIKHNSLEERLNAVKFGQPIPESPIAPEMNLQPQTQPVHPVQPISYKQFFITEGYKLFNVMAASVLYGYGINAIFSKEWPFIGVLGVGFLLNHSLTILLKLFKK